MKKLLLILILSCLSKPLISQEMASKSFTRKIINTDFNIDKLFNKQTGKKVTEKEFIELINSNPNIGLERIYDKYGNIIKYYIDSNSINNITKRSGNSKPKNGELFHELVFKTIDNKTINLKDLKGKLIILRFELFANDFRLKKDEIRELDKKINESNRQSEIESIIIFASPKDEILRGFDIKNSNFKLIPNGDKFHNMCHISRYPSTMIIDKNGILVNTFKYIYEIDINELLNR